MLLVTGLDLILVGRFQLNALAPYALASTLVTFIAGIQNGIFSAMMPHAAVLHARKDSAALGQMLVSATRLGVLLLLITGLPLMIYAGQILRIWVGPQYATQGKSLLTMLLVANMIRLVGTPYATALVATGQQRVVILSPLMEGVSNVIASTVLGIHFGAVGVAAGTLVGALVGVIGNLFYNMPRTLTEISISRFDYVISGIGLPFLATLPLVTLAVSAGGWKVPQNLLFFAVSLAVSLLLSIVLVARSKGLKRE
jgi:O-antigen/teichoic acid export membrane protein